MQDRSIATCTLVDLGIREDESVKRETGSERRVDVQQLKRQFGEVPYFVTPGRCFHTAAVHHTHPGPKGPPHTTYWYSLSYV